MEGSAKKFFARRSGLTPLLSENQEVGLFEGKWPGGYFEGDPLDPLGRSSYFQMGYISVLHALYQACVRPHVTPQTIALEIGPGRGAWTKTLLGAKEIWCLDALSADYNRFWEYVGDQHRGRVNYIHVRDFSCRELPDRRFDFLFSFGTFCHIRWERQQDYYRNLFPKMRPGASAFVMIADFDKFNAAVAAYRPLRVSFQRFSKNVVVTDLLEIAQRMRQKFSGRLEGQGHSDFRNWSEGDKEDSAPRPGRWYHAGLRRTCDFLESIGWEVVNPDVGLCPRDPVIHFRKPL